MKDERDIQREVEATLRALDDAAPVQARPFFYTRLEGRLQRSARSGPVLRWQWAALLLLLLLNLATLAWSGASRQQPSDYASAFINSYGLTTSDGWEDND